MATIYRTIPPGGQTIVLDGPGVLLTNNSASPILYDGSPVASGGTANLNGDRSITIDSDVAASVTIAYTKEAVATSGFLTTDAADSRYGTSPNVWVGCANESYWPDNHWGPTSSVVPAQNTWKQFVLTRSVRFIRLGFTSFWGKADTQGGPLRIRASVRLPDGTTVRRVRFPSGQTGWCDGGVIWSEPIPCVGNPGDVIMGKTWSSATDQPQCGANIVPTVIANGEGCDAQFNTAPADKTITGTVTPNASAWYGPFVVVGDGGLGTKYVGNTGDSIANGMGDLTYSAYGRGFVRRALKNLYAHVSIAVSGEDLTNVHDQRVPLLARCSAIVDDMGHNNWRQGTALATLQSLLLARWTELGQFGSPVYWCTQLPFSKSSDTWATTGNQTTSAYNSIRTSLNDWVRGGAPIVGGVAVAVGTSGALLLGQSGHPLAGYFETADTVETARNSGIWKVGYVDTTNTVAGVSLDSGTFAIHPNSTGHDAMSQVVDVSLFPSVSK